MSPFSHLKFAALSDVGKKRKNNEDAFGTFPGAGVFCVADGMGGGDDGEIASAAVVRAVEEMAARIKPTEAGGFSAQDAGRELSRALSSASAWICNRAHERKLNGCGSTFVGVLFDPTDPAKALAVHAGDSRLYLLHGRSIKQVTCDHSVAELMGEKDESKVNPMFRSMVVNGIGIRPKADPEFTPFKVAPGDRVLVCSDGLSRMVPDKKILAVSREAEEPADAVKALIAAALEAGGVDNVTAVIVQVGELPPPVARLEAPAETPSPEDAETEDGPTSSDDTGTTGETQTMATALTGIAEESAFGSEAHEEAAAILSAARSRRKRGRWFIVAAVALVVVAIAVIAAMAGKTKSDKPETPQAPARAALTNTPPPSASVPVERPAPAKEIAKPAPETPAPVAAAQTVRPQPSAKETAAVRQETLKAATASPSVIAFADACAEDTARTFVRALRRLLPQNETALEFSEESEQFLKSSRQLSLSRVSRDAETAAVDLRVLLLNAESVRAALTKQPADANVKKALAAWDAVLKGDPAEPSTQTACAQLVNAMTALHRQ